MKPWLALCPEDITMQLGAVVRAPEPVPEPSPALRWVPSEAEPQSDLRHPASALRPETGAAVGKPVVVTDEWIKFVLRVSAEMEAFEKRYQDEMAKRKPIIWHSPSSGIPKVDPVQAWFGDVL